MRRVSVTGQKLVKPVTDTEPDIGWVMLRDVVIDDDYQRPLLKSNWAAIRRIADNFSWARFGALILAPLPDGRFALIDGQHRAHAAMLCQIARVPAITVEIDKRKQAETFSWVNGNVTRISTFHIYKAALAAEEPWAVVAERAVTNAGCVLMTWNSSTANKKAGQVFTIALIREMVSKGYEQAVTEALRALRENDHDSRVALYSDYVLRPWLQAVISTGKRDNLSRVIAKHDPFRVLDKVERLRKEGVYGDTPASVLKRKAFETLITASGEA